MIDIQRSSIPEDHPVRLVFHQLTERGMGVLRLRDKDTIDYVTNLLIEFIHPENLYRIQDDHGKRLKYLSEILEQSNREVSEKVRRECYRHLGDLTLFNLGLFPESLSYGRHTVSPSFYAAQGRRSYTIVSELIANKEQPDTVELFRKLSQHFTECVAGLNWVKLYINDPFYQYMFREFQVI
jgi:hypothetical protein